MIFLQIMTHTYQNPNVVEATTLENRRDALENLSERLDATQKSLSNYLDAKRNSFARFFFISDDELLSVLGSSDPASIQVNCCSSNSEYFGRSSLHAGGGESPSLQNQSTPCNGIYR